MAKSDIVDNCVSKVRACCHKFARVLRAYPKFDGSGYYRENYDTRLLRAEFSGLHPGMRRDTHRNLGFTEKNSRSPESINFSISLYHSMSAYFV
jgi:hypothetical protein